MPLEPLYSLEVAAELIPCPYNTLVQLLHKHKEKFGQARFHTQYTNNQGVHVRMLTESECLIVRGMVIQLKNNGRLGYRKIFSTSGRTGFLNVTYVA